MAVYSISCYWRLCECLWKKSEREQFFVWVFIFFTKIKSCKMWCYFKLWINWSSYIKNGDGKYFVGRRCQDNHRPCLLGNQCSAEKMKKNCGFIENHFVTDKERNQWSCSLIFSLILFIFFIYWATPQCFTFAESFSNSVGKLCPVRSATSLWLLLWKWKLASSE